MSYMIEQWAEYGIGMCFFFLRFFARYKVVGLGGLTWDDLFSFIAMLLFTVDSATVQIINNYGSFVGLNEQSAAALSDAQASRLEVGSKALFVAWISYVSLIWSLKASLLCFYSRLTLGLWQQKMVKVIAVITFTAYVAVLLTLFGHCTPIQKNWQIKPYAGDRCTLTIANYIVVAALNVSTDLMILSIPLPLLIKVQLPLRRKIVIGLLLSSGIFVITAALLRCILSLASADQIGNSTIWGIRETFVSLIAVSAPAIKPLFNKSRWIGSSNEKGAGSGKGVSSGGGFRRFGRKGSAKEIGNTTAVSTRRNPADIESGWKKGSESESDTNDLEMKSISRNGSEEHIIGKDEHKPGPLKINVTTVYALADDRRDSSTKDNEEANKECAAIGAVRTREYSFKSRGESTTHVTVGKRRDSMNVNKKASRMLGMSSPP